MEAQLLQVALPEIQELYRTLLAKPSPVPQADRSSPVRPSSEKASVWEALGGWGGWGCLRLCVQSAEWRHLPPRKGGKPPTCGCQ